LLADRIAADRQRLDDTMAEQRKAEEALRATTAARQPVITKRDEATARVAALEKSMAEAKKTREEKVAAAENVKTELAAAEPEIARLDTEQLATRARIDELNQLVGALTKEQNDLRNTLNTLTTARDTARQARDQAVAARDAAPEKPELVEAARVAEDTFAKAESALEVSTAREAALPGEIEALRAELATIQSKHDAEIAALGKRREETKVLRHNLEELGRAINELSKSIAAADNEMKQAQARIEEARKAIATHDKPIAEATAARDGAAKRVAAIEARLRRWEAEPVLLEIRSAQRTFWDSESAVAEAKAAVDEAAALVEKETRVRDAARVAVLKGEPMAEARLFLAQSGLNSARRLHTNRAATADRLANELQSRMATLDKLRSKFRK
jgi:chromosome segregation protein